MEELEDLPSQRKSTFQITQNTSTLRKTSPTQLSNEGVLDLPRRSDHRRQLETLIAAAEVNGGSAENRTPALDGMFSTICKYGKIGDMAKYVSSSQKMRKATVAKIKMQCTEYEKSDENFIRSLSLLYAGAADKIISGNEKYWETYQKGFYVKGKNYVWLGYPSS